MHFRSCIKKSIPATVKVFTCLISPIAEENITDPATGLVGFARVALIHQKRLQKESYNHPYKIR